MQTVWNPVRVYSFVPLLISMSNEAEKACKKGSFSRRATSAKKKREQGEREEMENEIRQIYGSSISKLCLRKSSRSCGVVYTCVIEWRNLTSFALLATSASGSLVDRWNGFSHIGEADLQDVMINEWISREDSHLAHAPFISLPFISRVVSRHYHPFSDDRMPVLIREKREEEREEGMESDRTEEERHEWNE